MLVMQSLQNRLYKSNDCRACNKHDSEYLLAEASQNLTDPSACLWKANELRMCWRKKNYIISLFEVKYIVTWKDSHQNEEKGKI